MAKIVITTEYTRDINHVLNYVTYAGEKLEAQTVIFEDGSFSSVEPDEYVDFKNIRNIKHIEFVTKDGKNIKMSPDDYLRIIKPENQVTNQTILVDKNSNEKEFNRLEYIDYIANRPDVAKDDLSGLFGINGSLNLEQAKQQALNLKGNTWWLHIISLKREDAERVGYDNRKSWETLIQAKALDIAKSYNISLENLVINCAYHDKATNPHIHLFMTSKNKNEGFIRGGKKSLIQTSEKFKSMFFNEIFKNDVEILKQVKNEQEKNLKQNIEQYIKNVSHKNYSVDNEILNQFISVTNSIKNETGKKVYGYMSSETKEKINNFLRTIVEKDINIKKVYNDYLNNHKSFVEQYIQEYEKISGKLKSFENKFFNPLKNDNKEFHNQIIKSCLQYIKLDELENSHSATQKETEKNNSDPNFSFVSQSKNERPTKQIKFEKNKTKYAIKNLFCSFLLSFQKQQHQNNMLANQQYKNKKFKQAKKINQAKSKFKSKKKLKKINRNYSIEY